MKKNFNFKEEKTFIVTFVYPEGATQTVYWGKGQISRAGVESQASDWCNDLRAKTYNIK